MSKNSNLSVITKGILICVNVSLALISTGNQRCYDAEEANSQTKNLAFHFSTPFHYLIM